MTGVRYIVAAAVLVLTGCGGSDSSTTAEVGTASSSPARATSQAAPILEMLDACPQVEAMLPSSTVPKQPALQALSTQLRDLRATSDLETQNALDITISGVDDAAAAWDSGELLPALGVSEAYDGAIASIRHRCQAAGSSAFQ